MSTYMYITYCSLEFIARKGFKKRSQSTTLFPIGIPTGY